MRLSTTKQRNKSIVKYALMNDKINGNHQLQGTPIMATKNLNERGYPSLPIIINPLVQKVTSTIIQLLPISSQEKVKVKHFSHSTFKTCCSFQTRVV